MNLFLSYASEDRNVAEQIQLALVAAGHDVFFDKTSLPAGGDFHTRIRSAIHGSDMLIFLISPHSLSAGNYSLTELRFAREQWPHPKSRVLPVLLTGVAVEAVPNYLKAATVIQPEGDVAAEVVAAIGRPVPTPPGARQRLPRVPGSYVVALMGILAVAYLVYIQNLPQSPTGGDGQAAEDARLKQFVRPTPRIDGDHLVVDFENTSDAGPIRLKACVRARVKIDDEICYGYAKECDLDMPAGGGGSSCVLASDPRLFDARSRRRAITFLQVSRSSGVCLEETAG